MNWIVEMAKLEPARISVSGLPIFDNFKYVDEDSETAVEPTVIDARH